MGQLSLVRQHNHLTSIPFLARDPGGGTEEEREGAEEEGDRGTKEERRGREEEGRGGSGTIVGPASTRIGEAVVARDPGAREEAREANEGEGGRREG